ncbi:DUF2807 domain-containing protein [Flavobacterium sp. CYK-55]|uniref:GIN domain-containing protein n=1 Tax=Flavobacterium sp. CYK-55 TaxID=2835529 RepID=UPI001BCCAFC7|nr:DUF2807 domain-containing protein [Flavobacterium sp. CYK-55]MBS7786302.1 DUF2807 domain-containing protein [Flavobacterium sp. CYK-55]
MLKIITTLTLFLLGMLAKGQNTEVKNISDFSKINVNGNIELVYVQNPQTKVTFESADAELLKNTVVEVNKNTLQVYTISESETPVKVYVSNPEVKEIKAAHQALVTVIETLFVDQLKINLNDNAQFKGMINATEKVRLTATDRSTFSGRIDAPTVVGNLKKHARTSISGKANQMSVNTSGNSLFLAGNFKSDRMDLSINGYSKTNILAPQKLNAFVAEEAQLSYRGLPVDVSLNEEAFTTSVWKHEQLIGYNEK